MTTSIPLRQIRALFDDETIRVYQAYCPAIADGAVAAGRFVPPFSMARMTWIKPSFLWMMYRSDWGHSEGQERVLAISISRTGFEWALAHACLSHFTEELHENHSAWQAAMKSTCVRIQWDPERNIKLGKLDYRSIQIGLGGEASHRYVNEWICAIEDVTSLAHEIEALVTKGDKEAAAALLPVEQAYPLPAEIALPIGATMATVR